MASTVRQSAAITLLLFLCTTIFLVSGQLSSGPFGFGAMILAFAWFVYTALRYYIAYCLDLEKLMDRSNVANRISLPFLLERAHQYDQLAKDKAPYDFYHSPGFIFWLLSGAAVLLWLFSTAMDGGGILVPLLWTSALSALCYFVIYTNVNCEGRLSVISAAGVLSLACVVLYSLFSQTAEAGVKIVPGSDYVFGVTVLVYSVLTLPALATFLKTWIKHFDPLAVMGSGLWVFSVCALFIASSPAHLLAVFFAGGVSVVSVWFRVLRNRRPYYRAYVI